MTIRTSSQPVLSLRAGLATGPAGLVAAGLALALLGPFASAGVVNLAQNGSFETGDIAPWDPSGSFDPNGAEILAPGRLDLFALHLDAGEYDDMYHIVQALTPTPTDQITEVSLWSFSPTPRWGQPASVILSYDDGTQSEQFFPLFDDWAFVDATPSLLPGKVLIQIELSWRGIGDEGPSSEMFIDDVGVYAVPAPAAGMLPITVVLGSLARRRRESPIAGR